MFTDGLMQWLFENWKSADLLFHLQLERVVKVTLSLGLSAAFLLLFPSFFHSSQCILFSLKLVTMVNVMTVELLNYQELSFFFLEFSHFFLLFLYCSHLQCQHFQHLSVPLNLHSCLYLLPLALCCLVLLPQSSIYLFFCRVSTHITYC